MAANANTIQISEDVLTLLKEHSKLFSKWKEGNRVNQKSTNLNAKNVLGGLDGIEKDILRDILTCRGVAYWDGGVEEQRLSVGIPGGKIVKRPRLPGVPAHAKQAVFNVLEYLQMDDNILVQAVLLDCPAAKPSPILSGPMLQFLRENCDLLKKGLKIPNTAVEFDTTPILASLDPVRREMVRRILARESLGDWTGEFGHRRVHAGPNVLRPSVQSPEYVRDAIDDALEYLMASRNPEIQGQLIDCPVHPGLPPEYAQFLKKVSPIFQDEEAFDADGGIPSMQDFYDFFWSQPWATVTHFNCLVRMLLLKNVVQVHGRYRNYTLGFSQEVIQQVLDFLQVPHEYHEMLMDAEGGEYTLTIHTKAEKDAILARLPMLADWLNSFSAYPIQINPTNVNVPLRQMKAFIRLLRGQDIVRQIPDIILHTEDERGRQLPERNWWLSARPRQNRRGIPRLEYQTPYGQENVEVLEQMFGVRKNNPDGYWAFFNPGWRRNAQNALARAEEDRRTRRGYGRRAQRALRHRPIGTRYYNWNNRYNRNNYSNYTNNSERNEAYNATRGRRLTREEEERLNRDPWESNNEGGGRRKTRRNRK